MDYKANENGFEQYGKINSDKYKNYQVIEKFARISSLVPLKNSALEGVWVLKENTYCAVSSNSDGSL